MGGGHRDLAARPPATAVSPLLGAPRPPTASIAAEVVMKGQGGHPRCQPGIHPPGSTCFRLDHGLLWMLSLLSLQFAGGGGRDSSICQFHPQPVCESLGHGVGRRRPGPLTSLPGMLGQTVSVCPLPRAPPPHRAPPPLAWALGVLGAHGAGTVTRPSPCFWGLAGQVRPWDRNPYGTCTSSRVEGDPYGAWT